MQGEVGDSDKHDIRGVQKALTAGQCTAMQADRGGRKVALRMTRMCRELISPSFSQRDNIH